jgi:glutamate formiminotransferase/formiminotetrahydrofolate cyclodeaminase
MRKLIECVPNISEGRRPEVYKAVAQVVETVDGVKLLDIDPGKATNRTVITFVGEPEPLVEAAFLLIKKASEMIDMRGHSGEHPRFGATDVCPFVPVANADMQDCIDCAKKLGERVGKELGIPVYLYENAASADYRKNLATVRAGEYEGIADKIKQDKWKPDFGPAEFNAKSGNIAIGARDFLIAYNVNLNTTSVRRANSVAFDVREKGRIKREGDPITGEIVKDENGEPVREPGACKAVKGIGWYIEEYGLAQISMNLTNISITALHEAFDACVESAHRRGLRVTGSEIVGLVPKKAMLDAADYFLNKQDRSLGISEKEKIHIAVKSMGLDELGPFDAKKKIIEYMLESGDSAPLINMTLSDFADETASESPAPGGGSISAYVGALGVSLATMVANLSSHKRGWDDRWEEFSEWAVKGQQIKEELLHLVDADTDAFNRIMEAFRLPKGSEEEKAARKQAIQDATKNAIEVPFRVMELSYAAFEVIKEMAAKGNPNSVTDAGVGALCARSAVMGAFLNVKINAGGLNDKSWTEQKISSGEEFVKKSQNLEAEILKIVEEKI